MARQRGEPAIPGTSKEILEPPVYPTTPKNTPVTEPLTKSTDGPGVPSKEVDRNDDSVDAN